MKKKKKRKLKWVAIVKNLNALNYIVNVFNKIICALIFANALTVEIMN